MSQKPQESEAGTGLAWKTKTFGQLSTTELYEILRLRAEVFVVEQRCTYQDLDGIDGQAFHLTGRNRNGELICYMRIIPAGIVHERCGSMGRVVVSQRFRGRGIAREMLRHGLAAYSKLVGDDIPIEIEAQAYLVGFYSKYGFKAISDVFDLDGLPHVRMHRAPLPDAQVNAQ